MALAVSGAAASPAMGMYSTKSRAFLLTLANARLGLWFGNPESATSAGRAASRPSSVEPLMRELLGLTTDHNPYVYLSDGGHYENLGLWEMVSRRCRYIIVSDAGCDSDYTFDDLGNAVRRIRLDLGIPILFRSLDITRAGQGTTNPHAAIGRILYSRRRRPERARRHHPLHQGDAVGRRADRRAQLRGGAIRSSRTTRPPTSSSTRRASRATACSGITRCCRCTASRGTCERAMSKSVAALL